MHLLASSEAMVPRTQVIRQMSLKGMTESCFTTPDTMERQDHHSSLTEVSTRSCEARFSYTIEAGEDVAFSWKQFEIAERGSAWS